MEFKFISTLTIVNIYFSKSRLYFCHFSSEFVICNFSFYKFPPIKLLYIFLFKFIYVSL